MTGRRAKTRNRGGPTSPAQRDRCRRPLPKAEQGAVCQQLPIVDKAAFSRPKSAMALIGYARVSTEEQQTDPQFDELRRLPRDLRGARLRRQPQPRRACALPGADRPGDTLVVVRIDRLARSLSHLLEVIERLRAKGAHFRSLGDPVDTARPQGIFTLQVLGAAAELERALIRERTRAGLRAAKARGRVGGNPGLRARDPAALRRIAASRAASYLADLLPGLDDWLPVVRRLRPERPWDEVVRAVNAALPAGRRRWTQDRLVRAVRRLVAEGLADPALLAPAPRRPAADRLVAIVAGIARSAPHLTLRAIGAELARLRERTPRGGLHWSPSSVAHLLERARKAGLVAP